VFLMARGIDKAVRAIWLGPVMGLAPWVVHGWARGALVLLGLRFRMVGRPMAHPGAVVANHSSWLDIVVLQRAMRVFFVSKSEVAGWPVIGLIGRAIGTMFIERRPVEAKRQQEVLYRRLKRGDRMCIFPEGTSTDGQRVLPFKSALFGVFLDPELHDRLWVQPVAIRYRAPEGLPATFYGWWGEMDFGAHLARLLAQSRGGEVEVTFLEPLRAADFAGRKALAEAAQAAVAAGFGDPRPIPRSDVDAGAVGGV
jgi:lyso-ornithine lipid O-acyltransferase